MSDEAPAQDQRPRQACAPDTRPLIVGLGASAGGLEAFRRFLAAMPADSGLALVLVQHLDPDHDSIMAELLSKSTDMAVEQVRDLMHIAPNRVYVIPPDTTLTIKHGVLRLQQPTERHGLRMPIDGFFRSLAEDQGENAVSIVLSGTGTDGTLGLKAVKEFGGMAMAQTPDDAKFDSMPQSAAATGLVDHVLPAAEMPGRLLEYARNFERLRQGAPDGIFAAASDYLPQICDILRRKTGHDFSCYKQSTIIRRIQRRMQVQHAARVEAYVELLQSEYSEANELFTELLIGVTHFFRDPEAFEALGKQVLADIVERATGEHPVRVWVPACSTGEEAYSLAIALREHIAEAGKPLQVQIFATDIDQRALDIARQAVYPEGIAEQMSARRLARNFNRSGGSYEVVQEIREMCIFSPHDLIKDPPFSRLDLLSCRNLLIYLESELQRKLFPVFRYALQPQGYLFLGPSESIPADADLFTAIDKQHRIFRAKEAPVLPTVNLPLGGLRPRSMGRPVALPSPGEPMSNIGERLERLLLDNYAPATVIVSREGEIIYASGRTSRYLELPQGATIVNVVGMVRPELRLSMRTALHRAVSTHQEVAQENLLVEFDGQRLRINLIVRPLHEDGLEDKLLVVFQELATRHQDDAAGGENGEEHQAEAIQHLEEELRGTKEYLQSTIEELETSNEELKSSNEELMSLNEELQSSNEELQTSKEELQSVNEELQTVNFELSKKIEELDTANSDLANLLRSTQIPTIFLDRDLRIKRFTPVASEVFRLIESDVNRSISDITARFTNGDLLEEIRDVLRTLTTKLLDVHRQEGDRWYLMRISPYRTVSDVIDGVVITFADITERRQSREEVQRLNRQLEASLAELEAVLDTAPVGISIAEDPECSIIRTNRVGSEMLQTSPGSNVTKSGEVGKTVPYRVFYNGAEVEPDQLPAQEAAATGRPVRDKEFLLQRGDGSAIDVIISAEPMFNSDGTVRGAVTAFADISTLRAAERRAQRRALQQSVVADLGARALAHAPLDQLFDEACHSVAETLGNEMCKVLEMHPAGDKLLLRAGVGWQEGLVGKAYVGIGADSQAGYTLQVSEPVVVENLAEESRFSGPTLLHDHKVVSGISTIIAGAGDRPWGVLGTHSCEQRKFTVDDANFLQAVANILANAIARHDQEERLRGAHRHLETQIAERTAVAEKRSLQLRALAAELTRAERRERRRVAQLLHDHIQQLLVAAKMRLYQLEPQEEHGDVQNVFQQVDELINESIAASRSLTVELSPPIVQDAGLVAGIEWLARQMLEKHELEVDVDVDQEPENLPVDLAVFLFESIRELLFNVVKHSNVDRAQVWVHMPGESQLALHVMDNGTGFDTNVVDEERQDGGGYGLFSIRERLEYLGGQLNIRSTPGQGTTIELLTPIDLTPEVVADTAAETAAAPARDQAWSTTDGDPEHLRVLVVDDHRLLREGLIELLRRQPAIDVVGEAADGQEAVEAVRNLLPDVICMDVGMPRMNGVEATRAIKQEHPQIHIIGLSMHDDREMITAMQQAGASTYLTKGGPSERLLDAIRAVGRKD